MNKTEIRNTLDDLFADFFVDIEKVCDFIVETTYVIEDAGKDKANLIDDVKEISERLVQAKSLRKKLFENFEKCKKQFLLAKDLIDLSDYCEGQILTSANEDYQFGLDNLNTIIFNLNSKLRELLTESEPKA